MTPLPVSELVRLAPALWNIESYIAAGGLAGVTGSLEPADALAEIQGWLGTNVALPAAVLPPKAMTSKTQINDLIAWAQNHGRGYIALDEGVYDNSGAPITIPANFRVVGPNVKTCRVLVMNDTANGQNPVYSGVYSRVEKVSWEVFGRNTDPLPGKSPMPVAASKGARGIRLDSKAHWSSCDLYGFHNAFDLWGDHIFIEDCETFGCYSGPFRSADGRPRGNLKLHGNRFTGCSAAALLVDTAIEEDSLESIGNDYSFSQYGWLAQAGVTAHEFGFTNVYSANDAFESNHTRHIALGKNPGQLRKISGVMILPRSGPLAGQLGFPELPHGGLPTDGSWTLGPTDQNYVITSNNIRGWAKTQNDNLFDIYSAGGDQFNGSFIAGGTITACEYA